MQDPQRFSRPSQSATLAPLHALSFTHHPFLINSTLCTLSIIKHFPLVVRDSTPFIPRPQSSFPTPIGYQLSATATATSYLHPPSLPLSAISYQLPAISILLPYPYRLPAISILLPYPYRLSAISYSLLATSYLHPPSSTPTGYRL